MKNEGKVGKGDRKADVRLVMKDEIFQQLAEGEKSAQFVTEGRGRLICSRSLFRQGKFKVKGVSFPIDCLAAGT